MNEAKQAIFRAVQFVVGMFAVFMCAILTVPLFMGILMLLFSDFHIAAKVVGVIALVTPVYYVLGRFQAWAETEVE